MGVSDHIGGAQQTDHFILKYGRLLGYDITELNYYRKENLSEIISKKYDVVITGNVFLFSQIPGFLDWVELLQNHIRFEHDANNYLSSQSREKIFKNNKLSIFLSREHHDYFVQHHGECSWGWKDIKYKIINSPIDSKFYDYELEDRKDTLWVGLLHPLKGLQELKDYANESGKNISISAIGNFSLIHDIVGLPNVRFIGSTKHEDMPELYNRHKTLLYAPGQLEPFCRTVAEAILCGMEINTCNSPHKVGALELYNSIGIVQFRIRCNNSPKLFWETVKETFSAL